MEEQPVRYVPTPPSPPPASPTSALPGQASVLTPAVRHTMHDLHAAAAGRAWAARFGRSARARPAPGDFAAAADGLAPPAGDPLAEALAQFRAATACYACALRSEGARPEQMLVRVKAFVREAMAAEGWSDYEAVQALTAEAVGWSIAAYYDR